MTMRPGFVRWPPAAPPRQDPRHAAVRGARPKLAERLGEAPAQPLTPRERKVAALVAPGRTNRRSQIAVWIISRS
jgi:DNA-binding NarL/FixJ family response regulator